MPQPSGVRVDPARHLAAVADAAAYQERLKAVAIAPAPRPGVLAHLGPADAAMVLRGPDPVSRLALPSTLSRPALSALFKG